MNTHAQFKKELRAHQVRAELDASSDHIKAKISAAEQMKVHTMLVIGHRDMEANAVSPAVHGKGNLGAKPHTESSQTFWPQIGSVVVSRMVEGMGTRQEV